MATVKKRKRALAPSKPTFESGGLAVLAALVGVLFCIVGIGLMYVSHRNGMIYIRLLQFGIISVVLGVIGFIVALKVKPKAWFWRAIPIMRPVNTHLFTGRMAIVRVLNRVMTQGLTDYTNFLHPWSEISLQTLQAYFDHYGLLFKVFVGIQFGFFDLFDVFGTAKHHVDFQFFVQLFHHRVHAFRTT